MLQFAKIVALWSQSFNSVSGSAEQVSEAERLEPDYQLLAPQGY